MPILQNQRHEKFAQELATGKSATEAYCLAGVKPSRQNAARLRTKDDVNARVFELQQAAAKSVEISLESVCRELDEAIAVARAKGQAAPLVNAASLRARLGGLLVEKVELTQGNPFDGCETIEAISARMLVRMSDDHTGVEFTADDKVGRRKGAQAQSPGQSLAGILSNGPASKSKLRLRSGKNAVSAGNVVPRLRKCVHAIARIISTRAQAGNAGLRPPRAFSARCF